MIRRFFKRSMFVNFGIIISLITVVFVPLANATAGVYDEGFYSNNDILFTNPQAAVCSQSSSSAASLVGNTNAEKIWNWLKAQGLTSEQAAGVMGNLQAEGGFSPTRQEQNPKTPWPLGGWGLAQWTNGRRTAIVAALGKQSSLSQYYDAKYGGAPPAANGGRDPNISVDINVQLLDFELNYLMQESKGRQVSQKVAAQGYGTAGASEWDTLKKQTTVEAATVFWHNNFEVSNDSPSAVITNRGGFAQSAFNSFSGASSTGSTSASGCASSTSTGTFAATVMAYAWPDYHHAPYTQKTTAYQAAITKAISQGRYVGADGIDCGGFITTLMVDSGFDPTYNSNGKGGATGAQEAWLKANWQTLGKGDKINVATLQPGDVAMLPDHTFVFVGTIPGFNSNIASASQDTRAPMAGKESLTDSNVTWYRKKG